MSPMSWESYVDQQEKAALGEAMAGMIRAVLADNSAEDFADLERSLYRYTDCGASLGLRLWWGEEVWSGMARMREIQPGDVEAIGVGTIVEGVDEVVEHEFIYPRDYLDIDDEDINAAFVAAYDALVERVEAAAREIWERTHGCPHCDGSRCPTHAACECEREEDDWGNCPVNPDCAYCGGEGMIL